MSGITDPNEIYFKDGIWGWDTNQWRQLIADAAGHLQIDITASALPAGAATAARQDVLLVAINNQVFPATSRTIYNVTMTLANTEYNQALPANTKKLTIKCRGLYNIKLAFILNQSGVTYLTIPAGMAYSEDLIRPISLTLYFQCPAAAQVAEIVAWA